MSDPRVIVFGGSPDQLHQITRAIVGAWALSILPPAHILEKGNAFPPQEVVIFILDGPLAEALPYLEAIPQKLPGAPVILIAEKPDREDIIQAFRLGVKDCLLFPLEPDEFRKTLEGHWKSNNFQAGKPQCRRWKERLLNWLGIVPVQRIPSPASLKLGIRPDGLPESFFLPKGRQELAGHEVEAQFFGSFRLRVRGQDLPLLPGEKVNALFAYLLYNRQKPVHREILLSRFWEYTSPSSARKSLNVAIHTLRQHLQECLPDMEFIQYYNDNYLANPELDIITDVDQFLSYWHKGRAIEASHGPKEALEYYTAATTLYRGDFLEDMHYEEWCEQERDNLKETYLILLDRLGTFFLQEEACEMAGKIFRMMLEKDDCLENVHRKLILCYYRLGRRDKAIRQYYKCSESLRKELNIEPSQSTKELFRLINEEKPIPWLI